MLIPVILVIAFCSVGFAIYSIMTHDDAYWRGYDQGHSDASNGYDIRKELEG